MSCPKWRRIAASRKVVSSEPIGLLHGSLKQRRFYSLTFTRFEFVNVSSQNRECRQDAGVGICDGNSRLNRRTSWLTRGTDDAAERLQYQIETAFFS